LRFNPPTAVANAGLIDVDGNSIITAADDSPSGFFGHAVVDGFVQAVAPSAPTITSISPGSAAPGASVTITGTNLTGAQVTVCNVAGDGSLRNLGHVHSADVGSRVMCGGCHDGRWNGEYHVAGACWTYTSTRLHDHRNKRGRHADRYGWP
jgi:hypothetical protein